MFFDLDLRGDALPPRTLCLTFDDGPGPQTAALGEFLAGRAVAATFFLIGAHARLYPEVAARLRATGHLVGNHTDTHPTLVSFHRDGGDVVEELAGADAAIDSPAGAGEITYFRAPYGDWRDPPGLTEGAGSTAGSTVARVLNDSGRFPHLLGPIGWDIDAADWQFWARRGSPEDCGLAYLAAVEAAGRGIILLHDSSEQRAIREHNQTDAVVRWLVPILQERGYQFVRLDQVPSVREAASKSIGHFAQASERNCGSNPFVPGSRRLP